MYIKVHVYAGMKRDQLNETAPHQFELTVRAPAERNTANTRVREMIAEHYELPVTAVRIITGHHSPSKMLEITGLSSS